MPNQPTDPEIERLYKEWDEQWIAGRSTFTKEQCFKEGCRAALARPAANQMADFGQSILDMVEAVCATHEFSDDPRPLAERSFVELTDNYISACSKLNRENEELHAALARPAARMYPPEPVENLLALIAQNHQSLAVNEAIAELNKWRTL